MENAEDLAAAPGVINQNPPNHPVFQEQDNYSFEDSERFEEDSEVSWASSDGILTNQNWRGWAPAGNLNDSINVIGIPPCPLCPLSYSSTGRYSTTPNPTGHPQSRASTSTQASSSTTSKFPTLFNLSSSACAKSLTFECLDEGYKLAIERRKKLNPLDGTSDRMPDKIFLPIIQRCFPASPDDIRIYSCLANGNADEFSEGESLYNAGGVREVFQIGYLLSASVSDSAFSLTAHNVSLRVDRCRITSCDCSCGKTVRWCSHIVAVCLFRIGQSHNVHYRPTIWESVNDLSHHKLMKFTQYLINELPAEYLPIAQKMLDQINDPMSEISQRDGAPDPTDGGHNELALWAMEEESLAMNIQRLLVKFCHPAPLVHCDVQYLSSAMNPLSGEYSTLLRTLRSREPEGMWNLIAIVREMMSRRDENAVRLLRIITEQCLTNGQVLQWWYLTKMMQSGRWTTQPNASKSGPLLNNQLSLALLCDEVVSLWKSVALSPSLSSTTRQQLAAFLQSYHRAAVNCIWKITSKWETDIVPVSASQTLILISTSNSAVQLNRWTASFDLCSFPGFYSALQCCLALPEPFLPSIPQNNTLFLPAQCDLDPMKFNLSIIEPVAPKKSKSRKKKKKKTRSRNGRGGLKQPIAAPIQFEDEASLRRNLDAAFRHAERIGDEESTESGQESDVAPGEVPGTSAGGTSLQGASGLMASQSAPRQPTDDVDAVLAAAYQPMDRIDVRFAECEALAAHGYIKEATSVASSLTQYIIDNLTEQAENLAQPEMTNDAAVARSGKFVATLEKALYVAHILRANHLHSAMFKFALNVLLIPKYALATKFQQVKLHYLETELVCLLQRVQLSSLELEQLRSAASLISLSLGSARGDVPPISLVYFIFDKLSYSQQQHNILNSNEGSSSHQMSQQERAKKAVEDELLAFNAAVAALAFRIPSGEQDFPMLSESIRRQKAELSYTLIMRYKDSDEKLYKILDKLLDMNLHKMYSHNLSNANYFYEQVHPQNTAQLYGRGPRSGQVYPLQPPSIMQHQRVPVNRSISMQSTDSIREDVDGIANALDSVTVGRISGHRSSDDGCDSLVGSSSASSEAAAGPSTDFRQASSSQPGPSGQSLNGSGRARFNKNKRQLANAASVTLEAHVSNLFELAKRIDSEAGGGQNAVVFALGHNHQMLLGPATIKRLRMCALLIGMYALGLHNSFSRSWRDRTYSQQVPFIFQQVDAVGIPALEFVRLTWEAHLTPQEVLSLADKGLSPNNDPAMKEECGRLALAVLPHAYVLPTDDTIKVIEKIVDSARYMREAACIAIGQAVDSPHTTPHVAVFAEVLFKTAEIWDQLYQDDCNSGQGPSVSVQSPIVSMAPPNFQQFYQMPPQQPIHFNFNMMPPYPNQQHMCFNQQPMHMNPPMMTVPPQFLQQPILPPSAHLPPPPTHLSEVSGIHQSHSAPQLTAVTYPDNSPSKLLQSYNMGMKAMEAIEKKQYDEKNFRTQKCKEFDEELKKVFSVSCHLGLPYVFRFLEMLPRVLQSPGTGVYFINHVSQLLSRPFAHPQASHMAAAVPPLHNYSQPPPPARPAYSMHNTGGNKHNIVQLVQQIRSFVLQQGWPFQLANLYERTVELFFNAVTQKLNFSRVLPTASDEVREIYTTICPEFCKFLHHNLARRFTDELTTHIKRQKGFSKEIIDRSQSNPYQANLRS